MTVDLIGEEQAGFRGGYSSWAMSSPLNVLGTVHKFQRRGGVADSASEVRKNMLTPSIPR